MAWEKGDVNRKGLLEETGGLLMTMWKKCLRVQNIKMQGLGFGDKFVLRIRALVISDNA